ncbi:helix-turn-helix transcriptional regulator [Salinicola sp. JS01]|uniref:XRE family transcriptional regulator n=1 Tax=Salinicola sp. JS01 TaxID=3050071 RepID=UPI00255B8063|nr:helix-turn-helix transcriptional regulator [Salinicola sp. JS01]WIX34922.1 helix-turn-helix transcriptional regulator [Salinicola sp. JS01]
MAYAEKNGSDKPADVRSFPDEGIERFRERLQEAMGSEKPRAFAKRSGISEGAVRSYLSGDTFPGLDRLALLAQALGVDAQWLAFGAEKRTPPPELDEYALVPLYDAQCSAGGGAWNEGCQVLTHISFTRYSLRKQGLTPEHLSAIRVDGDSMEPLLHSGDTVLIDHTRTTIEGEGIYVLRLDGHLYAKRLQRQFDGVAIISANPIYDKVIVPRDRLHELEIIGRAVWSAGWL